MPLVFVHGVNVRKDSDYAENENARDGLFRKFALNRVLAQPANAIIENPYWGQFAAKLAFDNASLPDEKYQEFGTAGDVFEEILTELAADVQAPAQDQILLALARKSMRRAVDALWAAGAFTDSGAPAGKALAETAGIALDYVENNPRPAWLNDVSDNDDFTERLLSELQACQPKTRIAEAFGLDDVWNHLKTAATNLANSAAAFTVNPATRAVRPWVNSKVSLFLGDVFVYLKSRDEPSGGKIVAEVQGAFEKANQARTAGDNKLIVVAHSMGGNISYDILTSFVPKIEVDLFVTVGSQVGLFEELKLFRNSDPTVVAPAVVPRPANIKRWINVMDPNDILAYSTARIFGESVDTRLDNGAPVWAAHSAYFYQPTFHQRLNKQILEGR